MGKHHRVKNRVAPLLNFICILFSGHVPMDLKSRSQIGGDPLGLGPSYAVVKDVESKFET